MKSMRYNIRLACGHVRKTAIAPSSRAYAAYAAYVQGRRCPVCGQYPLEA